MSPIMLCWSVILISFFPMSSLITGAASQRPWLVPSRMSVTGRSAVRRFKIRQACTLVSASAAVNPTKSQPRTCQANAHSVRCTSEWGINLPYRHVFRTKGAALDPAQAAKVVVDLLGPIAQLVRAAGS